MERNIFNCEAFSLQHITTIEEVKHFAQYLVDEVKLNFHPDDDFADYRNYENSEPTFTDDEIELANHLMDDCFTVCEKENVDIYDVMGNYLIDYITSTN